MSTQASELRDHVLHIIRARGLVHFDEPVQLASGEFSRDFIDAKAALARGRDLETACRALLALVEGIGFDAVGGLTMGADPFAHVMAVLSDRQWFVVRKEPKRRGTNKLVEGTNPGPGTKVLLVDDVVTTGGSIQRAHATLAEAGATVVAAVTLVDRGEVARAFFAARSVPYFSLLTYRDLGIEPIGAPNI